MTDPPRKAEDSRRSFVLHERVDGRLVVAAACGLVALGGLASIWIETAITGDNPTTYDPGESARVYNLDNRDCFDAGPLVERNEEVTVVDCDDPHDSVLITIEHFSQYGDPDFDEAVAEAHDECTDDFEEYVAELGHAGDVELRLYHPDTGRHPVKGAFGERRWTVGCVAWSPTGRF